MISVIAFSLHISNSRPAVLYTRIKRTLGVEVDVCNMWEGGVRKGQKNAGVFYGRPLTDVHRSTTRMDREWEEQFMHQALEEAQLENSKLGNFAARKRCYQFRWQEICIRHLLKVYTLYRGAVLSNVEKYSMYRIVYVKSIN